MSQFTLLIVEDQPGEAEYLRRRFEDGLEQAEVVTAANSVAACNQARRHRPEVIVMDLSLGGCSVESGFETLAAFGRIDPTMRVIVLTGHGSDAVGREAIRRGAASFLTKPADVPLLLSLIQDAARTAGLRRETVFAAQNTPIPGMIGISEKMFQVFRSIDQAAKTGSPVLIIGETGTGKELAARSIHQLGARSGHEMAVFFGSAPAGLAEAELFGYQRGAFTGANPRGQDGCLKKADGSTLFIDELCSLDPEIQRKLLRALEERSFRPLGSSAMQHSDFRLVCAAQPRIYGMTRSGAFREDLLSRVEVVTIRIPPLRERPEDIVPLAEAFLGQVRNEISPEIPCPVCSISDETIRCFIDHPWPRNVRQLRHLIHAGVFNAMLRGSPVVQLQDVIERLGSDGEVPLRSPQTLKEAVETVEIELILAALRRNGNVLSSTCRELGVGRTTLWRKLKYYGIEQPVLTGGGEKIAEPQRMLEEQSSRISAGGN